MAANSSHQRPARPNESQHLRSYEYSTLPPDSQQIRLFELLPGREDDPIRGNLITVNLDSKPQYDALSYVWGDPRPFAKVWLNDSKYKPVAQNLWKALTSLRRRSRSRVLWIDAISINQRDIRERGHQVKMMGAVYSKARLVRVWLDIDVDIYSRPFQLLAWWPTRADESGPASSRHLIFNDYDMDFWKPVFEIFEDPYWARLWIQQEFLLAQDIRFHIPAGQLSASVLINFFHILREAPVELQKWIDFAPTMGPFSLYHLEQKFHQAWAYQSFQRSKPFFAKRNPLYRLFLRTNNLRSSDPRDRVYAMLAIATDKDQNEPPLEPDYALSVHQTYYALFKSHILQYQNIEFLCYRSTRSHQSFPTWLPSPQKHSEDLKTLLMTDGTGTPTFDPYATISSAGILRARGFLSDRITVSNRVNLTMEPFGALPYLLRNLCNAAGLRLPWLGQPISTNSSLLRLILFKDKDVDSDLKSIFGTRIPTESDLQDYFTTFIHALSSIHGTGWTISQANGSKHSAGKQRISSKHLVFANWLYRRLESAVFVVTDKARVGLGYLSCPEQTPRAGDEVWTLLGCWMPMILRPVGRRGSKRYQVIGPALIPGMVQGMMHGAMFDELEYESNDPTYQNLELESIELI